jgi:hypothetical protein
LLPITDLGEISFRESAERADLEARNIRYAAPKYRINSNTHAFASMIVPRPRAAKTDQISEPVVIPDARDSPGALPEAIDVPAIASVAGPGLAIATRAARRIRGRFISRSTLQ